MRTRLHQLKTPPNKWRKYELLEACGVMNAEYFQKTIQRCSWAQRHEVVERLRHELGSSSGNGREGGQLYVVKFVPQQLAMLLPNFRIQTAADIETLERAIQIEPRSYAEVWFCRTSVAARTLSVAGRILIDSWGGKEAHKIEQVWRCSPRLIERLDDSFPYPFVRATRPGWTWSPKIEQIHVPAMAPESVETVRGQFSFAMRKLDQARDRLEPFTDRLLSTGLSVCSLEYKIEGNNLQIIDWDTADDSHALTQLLSNETT